jgi:hypothetical protein
MLLIPKLTEPLIAYSRRDKDAETELFLRLQDMSGELPSDYNCSVQGSVGGFIVILSDPGSGRDVSAWSGSVDGIVNDFRNGLQRLPQPYTRMQSARTAKVIGNADNQHSAERLAQRSSGKCPS